MQLGRGSKLLSCSTRVSSVRRAFTTSQYLRVAKANQDVATETSRTRNIGIIAHIDAGKTTTTERMLYYSGHTRRIGNIEDNGLIIITDVDEGSTVTDFLPAERARGVTIQSAAISFHWPPLKDNVSIQPSASTPALVPHNINLIDTPGHADFTFEVLRSLRILDGAICILDAVAGVEAQTEKVWYQAAKYNIPKIIYVNKLDRDGAAFGETVIQIAQRLHTWPAVCQIPWWEQNNGKFVGLGDAVGLRALRWVDGGDGKSFDVVPISDLPADDEKLVLEIKKARRALVELLSEKDDLMVEAYLEVEEDHLAIPEAAVIASLRRCVLNPKSNIVPVFAGASFRNMGVQPLLDAIVQLLPNPAEAPDPEINLGGTEGRLSSLMNGDMVSTNSESKSKKAVTNFKKASTALIQNLEACALAFKVVHDPRRGALVYIRVYSGSIIRQSLLFNTNLQVSERAPQLLKMYASDSIQVDAIPAGQIGVIPSLKHARTGDTLISYTGLNPKLGPPAPLNTLQLRPIEVPPAVFFSSVEPNSLSEEKAVKSALDLLIREDPSLQVSDDEESGQTLLSGMGEFHLEIAQDRLVNDLKAKASMGKIEIAYREAILQSSQPNIYAFDREQGGTQGRAACVVTVEPLPDAFETPTTNEYGFSAYQDGNRITISLSSPEDPSQDLPAWDGELPSHLSVPLIHNALKNGALAALGRGINYAFPMHNTHVHIHLDPRKHLFGPETIIAALSSAARLATKAALKSTALDYGSALLELVMNVTVTTDEASLGAVVNDISSARGGHILSLDDSGVTSGLTVNSTNEALPRIDISRVYAPPDPFGSSQSQAQEQGLTVDGTRQRNITARVPLKEMVGYLKHLRSLTGGRGTFVMSADRFERVVGQREKVLLKELKGF